MQHWVFVGTKADGREGGRSLPVLRMDAGSGALALAHPDVAALPAPSWLALAPDARFIYAVCRAEARGGAPATGVGSDDPADHFAVALAVDRARGTARELNRQRTGSIGPAHCGTDGRTLVTAQFVGGGVSAFGIRADGSLAPAHQVIEHGAGSGAAGRGRRSHSARFHPSFTLL